MKKTEPDIALHYYQALAEFRYQIRRFLRFSEQLARSNGIEPQQHQLLLAVKGLPGGKKATISELAERMQLQHHSVVELVDRLVERSFVERQRDTDDQRRVLVNLTSQGETILQQLSVISLAELQQNGPSLVKALSDLLTQEGLTAQDEPGDDAMN
jgi:DNA-binding MarR family transcriptional regulator